MPLRKGLQAPAKALTFQQKRLLPMASWAVVGSSFGSSLRAASAEG